MLDINLSAAQHKKIHEVLNDTFRTYCCVSDESYRYSILPGIVVAGGAIPSLLQDKEPNDFDVYFTDTNAFISAMKYVGQPQVEKDKEIPGLILGSTGKKLRATNVSYITDNAISFTNKVQVITRFIGDVDRLFETFDFEHCKVYWKPSITEKNSGSLHFSGRSLESFLKRKLIYTGKSRFVLSAMKRHEKFIKRGWKTTNATRLALMKACSEIDWKNPKVVEEQLKGYYGADREECEEFLNQFKENNKE